MSGGGLLTVVRAATVLLLVACTLGLQEAIVASKAKLQKIAIEPPDGLRFHSLPIESQTWERYGADPAPLPAEIIETLGTRNYITRRYIKKGAQQDAVPRVFELHCTYFTGMAETVPHVPETCFVGGGMRITEQAKLVHVPLDLSRFPPDPTLNPAVVDEHVYGVVRRGRTGPYSEAPGVRVHMPFNLENLTLRVTKFESPEGDTIFAGYFFLANGWAVSSALQVRQRAFDLKTNYAYFGKVQFTSTLVHSPEELAELAADFLNEMLPEIMRRVPDWVDVIRGVYPPDRTRAHRAAAS